MMTKTEREMKPRRTKRDQAPSSSSSTPSASSRIPSLLAGAAAGVFCGVTLQPLDVIKYDRWMDVVRCCPR